MITAVLAVVIPATSASAASGDGTVNVSLGGNTPCILEFDHASPPAMNNLVHPFTCVSGLNMSTATLNVNFSGGTATMTGSFSFVVAGTITCVYSASISGTYADSSRFRYFSLGPQDVPRISGSSLFCPNPATDLEFSNGVIEL